MRARLGGSPHGSNGVGQWVSTASRRQPDEDRGVLMIGGGGGTNQF